jgi:4-azaleucine resistance transporter AzlC
MRLSGSFRTGVRDGFPVFLAVAVFGVAYGVLAIQVGLAVWLAVFSSLVIVSGAAQFAMVGLLAGGAGPVLVATTGLALRHLPMSAKLATLIGDQPPATRARLAWVLTDETFGLTLRASSSGVRDLVAYKTAADLLLYSAWVAGTAGGALVGKALDPASLGIDVLFALLFLGLAAPLVRLRRDWVVVGAAIAATLLASVVLPDAWQITGAATVAALVGTIVRE